MNDKSKAAHKGVSVIIALGMPKMVTPRERAAEERKEEEKETRGRKSSEEELIAALLKSRMLEGKGRLNP